MKEKGLLENGEKVEMRLEDQTHARNIFNYCFGAAFVTGGIFAMIAGRFYPPSIFIAIIFIICASCCIWYGIVDSKKRYVVITNKKVVFLTPKFFGGMKLTEIRWFKLVEIVFKIEHTHRTHDNDDLDYYFVFKYENGLVKEVQKGVSVSSFSYSGMVKTSDALKKIAQERGVKHRAYEIKKKEFGEIISKKPI